MEDRENAAEAVDELRHELDRLAEALPESAADPVGGADVMPEVRRVAQSRMITGDHPPLVAPGPLAPAKRVAKGAVRKASRWYVERLALDVRTFADAVSSAVASLAERLNVLEARAAALETRAGEAEVRDETRAGEAEVRDETRAREAEVRDETRAREAEVRDGQIDSFGRDVKRELSALRDRLARLERDRRSAAPVPPPAMRDDAQAVQPSPSAVTSLDYFAFESTMRGSREEIAERQRGFLEAFSDVDEILDVGCGRGEFLELLGQAGKRARGVDADAEMAAWCQDRGLDVTHGDGIAAAAAAAAGSLGGIFAAQVVEHLPPPQLVALLEAARAALREDGVLALETINPASLSALRNYFADLTHAQPLVPETLAFLVETAGFREVRVELRSPVPEAQRLRHVPLEGQPSAREASDHNVDRLNDLLFAPQDYAVFARA